MSTLKGPGKSPKMSTPTRQVSVLRSFRKPPKSSTDNQENQPGPTTTTASWTGQTSQTYHVSRRSIVAGNLDTPSSFNQAGPISTRTRSSRRRVLGTSRPRSPTPGAKWLTKAEKEQVSYLKASTGPVNMRNTAKNWLAPSATSTPRQTRSAQTSALKSGTGTQSVLSTTQCRTSPRILKAIASNTKPITTTKAGPVLRSTIQMSTSPNQGCTNTVFLSGRCLTYSDNAGTSSGQPKQKTVIAGSSKQKSPSSSTSTPGTSSSSLLSAISTRSFGRLQYFSTVASLAQPLKIHETSGDVSLLPSIGRASSPVQEIGSKLTTQQTQEASSNQGSSFSILSSPPPPTSSSTLSCISATTYPMSPSLSRTTYFDYPNKGDIYTISPTANKLRSDSPSTPSTSSGQIRPPSLDGLTPGTSGQSSQYYIPLEHNRPFLNSPTSVRRHYPSPRPAILRRRDRERTLSPFLHPDSREASSTTLSAMSSPSFPNLQDDETNDVPPPVTESSDLQSDQQDESVTVEEKPVRVLAPRKKPRKQKLSAKENSDDVEYNPLTKKKPKRKRGRPPLNRNTTDSSPEPKPKPAPAPKVNRRRQDWTSTIHHFPQYLDVKTAVKKPTITELASEKNVLQRAEGWKVHHLSTQLDDLAELETEAYDKLDSVLKLLGDKETDDQASEFKCINDLVKGNMQRTKLIAEGMNEAKSKLMKVFEHKPAVTEILTRVANVRHGRRRQQY